MADLKKASIANNQQSQSETAGNSARIKAQQITRDINKAIENLSVVHATTQHMLNEQHTYDRLENMLSVLGQGQDQITELYNELQQVLSGIAIDHRLVREIDCTTEDNRMLGQQLADKMSQLSVRQKYHKSRVHFGPSSQSQEDTCQADNDLEGENQTNAKYITLSDIALDKHSTLHSKSSHSHRSSYKSASSHYSLRVKQAEAKAAVAERKALLAAEIETQKIEENIQKQRNLITQTKIRAEIEAENKKQEIFAKAIIDEEQSNTLFRPPHSHSPTTPQTGDREWVSDRKLTGIGKTSNDNNIHVKHPQFIWNLDRTHIPNESPCNSRYLVDAIPPPPNNDNETQGKFDTDVSQRIQTSSPEIQRQNASQSSTSISSNEAFADTLAEAINSIRLKPAQPPVFYGDPLEYLDWKVAFEGLIESGRHNPLQKLSYLQQYLGERAKEAVAGLYRIGTEDAYKEAKNRLEQRYGQPYVISEAFRTKLEQWPTLKENDGEGLERLSDFLESCLTGMKCVEELYCMNDRRENMKLIRKLPLSIGRRWVAKATQIEGATKRFPTFKDFCGFVSEEARVATNPISRALANRSAQVQSKYPDTKSYTTQASLVQPEEQHEYTKKRPCAKCNLENHNTSNCNSLAALNRSEQLEFVKENKLCFRCIKPNHIGRNCKYPAICRICKLEHPTIFHAYVTSRDRKGFDYESNDSQASQIPLNQVSSYRADSSNKSELETAQVMTWAIPVYISSANEPEHEILIYALLDSGSNSSFVTKSTIEQLKVNTSKTSIKMSTLTNVNGLDMQCNQIQGLRIRGYNQSKYIAMPTCLTQDAIPINPNHIPNALSVEGWPHLKSIQQELISRPSTKLVDLGLLIGSDLTQAFIPRDVISGENHEPFAQRTDLGWCIMGDTSGAENKSVTVNRVVIEPLDRKQTAFLVQADELSKNILDTLSSDFTSLNDNNRTLSLQDKQFLDIMNKHIYKDQDGYMTMPLPLKTIPVLNKSKAMAIKRFNMLQKKLNSPDYSAHYHAFMQNIIEQGNAELVPESELSRHSWYLPHFGVYHPKKPGKIRVVFDGSARVGGFCLNDFLLQGPDQLNSLLGILLRFRKENVAIGCDVERMFYQFRVSPEHRDYLRFRWFDDQNNVLTYRMKVHIFGAKSSPGCATFGLRSLCTASTNNSNLAKEFIRNNFYVDDGLTSVTTPEIAKNLAQEAIEICKEGNLRLHKFTSNCKEFLEAIPCTERNLQNIQSLDPDKEHSLEERTLGLMWNPKTDRFNFGSQLQNKPPTRRGVLSTIASIYDPLGLISPYILQGKLILQEMCRSSARWDEPLADHIAVKWKRWKNDLGTLKEISISRCYKPLDFGKIVKVEFHHFADASSFGYGEVSYLRLVNTSAQVHCSLLMSKARVTPLKQITIPRLELQAAVVAAQVSNFLEQQLEFESYNEFFWTDSQVVLGYINNESKAFHVFVGNRVQQIRDLTSPKKWLYVPTSINPADYASRGLSPDMLAASDWFTGPNFLWHEPLCIPKQPQSILKSDDPEIKCNTMKVSKSHRSLVQLLDRFSEWKKAVSFVKFLVKRCYSLKKTNVDDITLYNTVITKIIQCIQEENFPEMKALKQQKQISESSKLKALCPFLDNNNVMRVGGRLKHSTTLDFTDKHPIILPKISHVVDLMLKYLHEEVAHQGRGITLAKVRASGYWIVGVRGKVSAVIHKCVTCRRLRANPAIPKMASLPQERSSQSPPFTFCGVDCFGPFMVKDRRAEIKRYGLMVTCLASRAVHIEVLDDLSTSAFINGIRNVIAVRGPIRQIWCDRGTNFVGALSHLRSHGVLEFKLNPPCASHMGGTWERMIRTTRSVLHGLLRNHSGRLDTSGLRTLLYEVMAIVNSRPLTTVSEESTPLTPNLLLTMKSDVILPPPGKFDEADIYAKKRWRAVQHLANVFWHRWRTEYISQLQIRQKWTKDQPNVSEGAIVLIKDECTHRNQWITGRVVECIISKDSNVRSVKLLLGNRVKPINSNEYLIRPVSKIIVLIPGTNDTSDE